MPDKREIPEDIEVLEINRGLLPLLKQVINHTIGAEATQVYDKGEGRYRYMGLFSGPDDNTEEDIIAAVALLDHVIEFYSDWRGRILQHLEEIAAVKKVN